MKSESARTRRAKFLADMDRIIPWPEMTTAVATVYPKISEQGVGLARH